MVASVEYTVVDALPGPGQFADMYTGTGVGDGVADDDGVVLAVLEAVATTAARTRQPTQQHGVFSFFGSYNPLRTPGFQ